MHRASADAPATTHRLTTWRALALTGFNRLKRESEQPHAPTDTQERARPCPQPLAAILSPATINHTRIRPHNHHAPPPPVAPARPPISAHTYRAFIDCWNRSNFLTSAADTDLRACQGDATRREALAT